MDEWWTYRCSIALQVNMASWLYRCQTAFIFTRWYDQFNARSRGSRWYCRDLRKWYCSMSRHHVCGLMQDCSFSDTLAMEILNSCIKLYVIEPSSKGVTYRTKYVRNVICSLNIIREIWHSGVFHSSFHMHLRCKNDVNVWRICLRRSTTFCFKETDFCNWIFPSDVIAIYFIK